MLENDLVAWLNSVLGCDVHYQHLDRKPATTFAWFIRSGDDSADSLDDDGEPDQVFFDLELYSSSLTGLQSLSSLMRSQRDYRGDIGTGYVDDIAITDQVDDYQLRANADTLPEYSTSFRLTVTGYIPN